MGEASGSAGDMRDSVRLAARETWTKTADDYFVEAVSHFRSDPARSLDRLRLFLEGRAHAVCLAHEAGFKAMRGKDLHRVELSKALEIATRHLPEERRDLVRMAKTLGDLFHHNQGARHRTTVRTAHGVLLHCAELLEWLHGAVLLQQVPASVRGALEGLQEEPARRGRPPILVALGLGAVVASIIAAGAVRGAWSVPDAPSVTPEAPPNPAAVAPVSPAEVLQWVKRYEAALAARDIPRLLAIHRHPTKRWFLAENVDFDRVRRNYEDAFRKEPDRMVTFQRCELAATTAVRCMAVTDPVLAGYPDGVPTCLTFDPFGRLIGRTEIKDVPQCPPID